MVAEVKVLLGVTQDPMVSKAAAPDNYSLGLCYLAAYAGKYGTQQYEFKITNNIPSDLESFHPDVVGIGSSTKNFAAVADICRKVKKFDRDIRVVVGGHHISALPNELPEDADHAVVGEGEQAFLDILEGHAERGIVTRPPIQPLDRLPFPARDLISLQKDRWWIQISSRGCPYHCVYCSTAHFWKKVRYNSAKYVVDELETFDTKRITFKDDLFIGDRKRLYEIADLLEQRKLDVEIACSVRANLVDMELIGLLKRLNIQRVTYGAESGCERTLQFLKAGTATVKQNYDAVRLLKKHGFIVLATFIVGAPTETLKEAYETLKFIKDAPLDDVELCNLTPYPGTPLFSLYKGDKEWNDFDVFSQESMTAKNLTPQELRQIWLDFHKIQHRKRLRYLFGRGVRKPWKLYGFMHKRIWTRG